MLKAFQLHCPTEDKEVTLIVHYCPSTTLEDLHDQYAKGCIHSCSGNNRGCNSCKLYNMLPDKITS